MSLRRFGIALGFLCLPAFGQLSTRGIKNFHEVNEHVYRGAQPTNEGLQNLAAEGVKLVIDLRESGRRADAELHAANAAGMQYINVPMTGLAAPTGTEIVKILGLLENSGAGSVFVHCMRGADRTGAVIAAYRIEHDHWDNARALREAVADGMSFFQYARMNFIRNFRPQSLTASEPVGTSLAP